MSGRKFPLLRLQLSSITSDQTFPSTILGLRKPTNRTLGIEETLIFHMAPSKLKQALGAVKDRTTIGLAKVASTSTLTDLDVAIVKATRHDDIPSDDKYIREIISLTCYSRLHITSCIATLAKRLNKTKNWIVALKTLMLIHRLLVEGDPAVEEEIFFSLRRGTRFLNMSDFCDNSMSDSWDYSAFVQTFALYLDGWLEYRMECRTARRRVTRILNDSVEKLGEQARQGFKAVPVQEMDDAEVFCRMHFLQQLLDRFLACQPTGGANKHRLVLSSLRLVVKESFRIYSEIAEIRDILLERFMDMEASNSIKVYDIFVRMQKQFDELDVFYGWSKVLRITGTSEYPEVERITQKQLDDIDIEKCLHEKSEEKRALRDGTEAPIRESEVKIATSQHEVDLLNLDDTDDGVASEERENKLGNEVYAIISVLSPSSSPKEDLPEETFFNWETALVKSTSTMPNQNTTQQYGGIGGGFDMRFLDQMYEEGAAAIYGGSYESSVNVTRSVGLGFDGKTSMLSLHAPPTSCLDGAIVSGEDPFAATGAVVPAADYSIPLTEMENHQKVLMPTEQLMWPQTYAATEAMQAQSAMAAHQYQMGVYTRN